MAIPIVKRYLIVLELYKWVGVATFALALGVSGIVAMRPVPKAKHTITGKLINISPPVLFSETATKIQEQAAAVPTETLLNDEVRKVVAEKFLVDPKIPQIFCL